MRMIKVTAALTFALVFALCLRAGAMLENGGAPHSPRVYAGK